MLEDWQKIMSPAPWEGDHGEIYDAHNNVVVFMQTRGEKFNAADEAVIAAAPDLLNALIGCANRWTEKDEIASPALGVAMRLAIKKALKNTGGSE